MGTSAPPQRADPAGLSPFVLDWYDDPCLQEWRAILSPLLTPENANPDCWLFPALAHWRSGDKEEARRCLKIGGAARVEQNR